MIFKQHLWARNAFTQLILGESITPIELTADEAQAVSFGSVFKKPEMKTAAHCKKIYYELLHKMGPEDGRALLQRFGAPSIDSLYIGLYENFYQYARKSIDFELSPHHPWDIDKADNHDLRKRWLIRDTKDDRLFEIHEVHQANIFLRSQYDDVTGYAVFEEQYALLQKNTFQNETT